MSRRKGKRSHKTRRKKTKHRQRRFSGRNQHHLTARSKSGSSHPSNLLLIDIEKHVCWHRLFKLKNLRQVIELLQRVEKLKGRQS